MSLPAIQDSAGDTVIVTAKLAENFPCKCVELKIEERGQKKKVVIMVDRNKVTPND